MQPYYQDEWVTLFHGDCLEITEWLSADVLVTDPPYGMRYVSGHVSYSSPIANDHTTRVRDRARQLWGDSKPWLMFGTWKCPRPEGTSQVLIWDKTDGTGPGMGNLNTAFGNSHEEIYLGGNWPRTGLRRGSVIRTSYVMGGLGGLAVSAGHPTPKPTDLMELFIGVSRGVVADPFAGSGSTLVAAKNQNRRAIGVELEERYCEVAAKRLAQDAFDFAAG